MNGYSNIYVFPFRIYSASPIGEVTAEAPEGLARFRIHRPFTMRERGSPITQSPPFERWPAFAWSDRAPPELRAPPPTDLATRLFGDRYYDAIRVDAWGDQPDQLVLQLTRRFLTWLRYSTEQSWIMAYEAQTDHPLKNAFEIDSTGAALASPWASGRFISGDGYARPATQADFATAANRAAASQDAPQHWLTYFDAHVARAMDDVPAVVLELALSLEICRNSIYPSFAKTRVRHGIGAVLDKPFDGTDLLAHLNERLASHIGRSLATEQPELWPDIRRLYQCRHHVAHGRDPVVINAGRSRQPTEEDLRVWLKSCRAALLWVESLRGARRLPK